jgi:putative transposase
LESLSRPLEGDWPYLWIDATYLKVRQSGRIVSVAVIVAVGVNSDGRREVLGMDIGPSEAETFWTEFLRKLARRGLRGVKLVISDAHEGIKAAVAKVLHATWQRCRVHFMRNVLAHAGQQGRRVVAAFIGTAFVQDDAEADIEVARSSAPYRCRRHLPQRRCDHAPYRRALLLEQNDEWAVQRGRYMSLEMIAPLR